MNYKGGKFHIKPVVKQLLMVALARFGQIGHGVHGDTQGLQENSALLSEAKRHRFMNKYIIINNSIIEDLVV